MDDDLLDLGVDSLVSVGVSSVRSELIKYGASWAYARRLFSSRAMIPPFPNVLRGRSASCSAAFLVTSPV